MDRCALFPFSTNIFTVKIQLLCRVYIPEVGGGVVVLKGIQYINRVFLKIQF